jgi:hypothetical protein
VSGPRQYILGVDLDGVCGDYTSAFRDVVARERGIDASTLGDQRSWDFVEWGIEPGAMSKCIGWHPVGRPIATIWTHVITA